MNRSKLVDVMWCVGVVEPPMEEEEQDKLWYVSQLSSSFEEAALRSWPKVRLMYYYNWMKSHLKRNDLVRMMRQQVE